MASVRSCVPVRASIRLSTIIYTNTCSIVLQFGHLVSPRSVLCIVLSLALHALPYLKPVFWTQTTAVHDI